MKLRPASLESMVRGPARHAAHWIATPMRRSIERARSVQLAIAVGSDHLTCVPEKATNLTSMLTRWSRAAVPGSNAGLPDSIVDVSYADGSSFEEKLGHAFVDVRTRTDVRSAKIHIVLLPGLCECRLIELPPLDEWSAGRILRRDASHFFPDVGEAEAVAVAVAGRGKADGRALLAALCRESVILAIESAAESVGWRVVRVVPALPLWVEGGSSWAHVARGGMPKCDDAVLLVAYDETTFALRLDRGRVAAFRRIPTNGLTKGWRQRGVAAADALAELVGYRQDRRCVAVIGTPEACESLANPVGGEGLTIMRIEGDPDVLAARLALTTSGSRFMTDRAHMQRVRHRKTSVAVMLAASLMLLFGAAGLEFAGIRRERDAVRVERDALAGAVRPLLLARDTLAQLEEHLLSISDLASRGPRWTPLLVDLSLMLPDHSFITGLRTEGDTVHIDGWSERTGEALHALRASAALRNLQVSGSIRREERDGGVAIERFSLIGQLVTPPASGGDAR